MTNGTANESYTFDAVGNRTASHQSSTYSYSPFNRLTATDSTTQSFDANGNMVQKSEGSNFWHYFWDEENRLTSVSTRKQTVRYVYDALGRRVRRHFAGSKENTKYTYDGLDVVLDDDLGVTTKYQNGLGIDNKLELATGSTSKYFLQDHLGSTIGLTNSSGSITESNSYDSFGTPSNPTFSSRYGFTGREFDSFSGLQYSRARFYDPKIGGFVSEDPVGFYGGGVNQYGYVSNNPMKFRDPTGLQRQDRDRPGDFYPGMHEPYKPGTANLKRDIACPLAGYNPWITLEFGGALQLFHFGGADSIVIAFNPLTQETSGYTKLMSGTGAANGLLATAGAQLGVALGPAEGKQAGVPTGEIFVDASAFEGGAGSVTLFGGPGIGIGVGPTIGGGAAGGLRIGETTPLFSINPNSCECRR